ncbi:unnamed protein product [Alternaria alternata]
MFVVSMKNGIAVRTRVAPKPSASAQIWKDIAKVISHPRTEVASGAPNLVAESRTQEKTICASTIGSSTDDLSIPALWFSELGLSHYGKQYLLESYFKWQSYQSPLNFATTYFWIHRELLDYSTSSIRSLSSLPIPFDSGLIQCQQSHGAVTSNRLYDLLELFRVAGHIPNDFPAVDRPSNSDLVKSILSWSNSGTHNVWMRCKEHVKSKSRTSAFSFASMAPDPWSHEDEVIPNFRTPSAHALRSTAFWDFVLGHEDEVKPNFRTPPANTSHHTIFWDFVSGYERTVIPTFRSRPLFYGLHAIRLGIG